MTAVAPTKREAIAAARAAVKEAHENYLYWRRRAVVCLKPKDRAQAAALREAWKTTYAARFAALETLNS